MSGMPGFSLVAGLFSRIRSLLQGLRRRTVVEAEMNEEFRHHLELRTEHLVRQGLSRKEAARRARIEFGHVESHKEEARASRGLHIFDEIRFSWLDVKLGLRMLVKYPGLTVVAVFALAVGIPVGMAPMYLANVIEAPLRVDEGDRIRAIRYWNTATRGLGKATFYDLTRWREELTSFQSLGATRADAYNVAPGVGGGEEDGRVASFLGAEVTASTFEILRERPLMGRTFSAADEVVGASDVVVIGYDLWQSLLGGDPAAVGRTIRIARVPYTVVGVMPEGFLFPVRQQLWLPLRQELADVPGEGLGLRILGRLAEGVSPQQAQAEMAAVGRRMAQEFPSTHVRLQPEVVPFGFSYLGIPRGGLEGETGFYFFQLLGLFLLLVACANVAMLIFARTATRFRELAVRTALGASRVRVLSQMFAESLVLALMAAGLGLASADWMLGRVFAVMLAADVPVPYWLDLGVTGEAVASALGLAVLSAVIAGVAPGLKVTRAQVQQNIQRARAGESGIRFGGLTSALVVADVAIAITVVGLAAGVSGRVMEAWKADELVGIQADEYLAVEIRLARNESAAGTDEYDREGFEVRLAAAQRTLVERLEAEPGVRSVAVASALPRMDHTTRRVEVQGEETSSDFRGRSVRTATIDLDFFDALDQPILHGRTFDWTDLGENASAVIVNTAFVDRILEGRNPLGQRVRFLTSAPGKEPRDGEKTRWYEIVGVVGHLGMNVIQPEKEAGIYLPAAPGQIHPFQLAIHLSDDPETFTPRLRELVSDVDPTAVLSNPRALHRVFQGDWYLMVALNGGLVVFLGILIALAASGIFAMMSFAVSERTREIGIRTALGARRITIVRTILRRTLAQLALGTLIGMPLAFFAVERSVEGRFVVALAAGVGVMALIGLFACTVPTMRLLRIEPTEALRGVE